MDIQIRRTDYQEVRPLHELYRREANCQIVHDSFLARGLADPYLILVNRRVAGYAGIGNKYPKDCLTEFYTLPSMRSHALPVFREVLKVSQATHIEAQTNIPLMLLMLYDCAKNITGGPILFADAFTTNLTCPDVKFRRARPEDSISDPVQSPEAGEDWVLLANGGIVATGGFLCHYNPPYGDVFMEVVESQRQKGYGSFMVQELKRVCYEAGKKPAARCNPDNVASRRTLQKAGFLPCGRLLMGEVDTM